MKKTTVKNKRKLQQEEPINFLEELKRLDKELDEGKKGIMSMFMTMHEATKILVKEKLYSLEEREKGNKKIKFREL